MLKKCMLPFADEMKPSVELGSMNGGCSVCMDAFMVGWCRVACACVLKECMFEVCVCMICVMCDACGSCSCKMLVPEYQNQSCLPYSFVIIFLAVFLCVQSVMPKGRKYRDDDRIGEWVEQWRRMKRGGDGRRCQGPRWERRREREGSSRVDGGGWRCG